MTAPETPDPRPLLGASLDQVDHLLAALTTNALDRPTPCAEFDVRTLIAHLVAVLRKLEMVRNGDDMTRVADPADDVAGNEVAAFRRARADFDRAWAPDASLDPDYTVAWGTMSGFALLDAYTHEFTVHAWDLAQVTGRLDGLDTELSGAALDWYTRNVPADDRPEGGPFAPAVPVPADADTHTRLAAFVGRPSAVL